ncbi:MAG: ATP-binding cassette domain-containing protein, partial [Chloroflexota bacterium]|nr:ATP-binding cassette domain-containing protein [Chloroflexota bacterium]
PVLEDVSFTIAPGQVVALVGENGAGKSTLVKLLTRLYDPTAGQILVDGIDLRDLDLEDWRSRVGVVLQDFSRYALPARVNIGIGSLPLMGDSVAVRAAAVRAGADTLVERLPEQYETVLGRRFRSIGGDGVDLSGGEWQRIALARAFMRAPLEQIPEEARPREAAGGISAGQAEEGDVREEHAPVRQSAEGGALQGIQEEEALKGAIEEDAGDTGVGRGAQLLILDEPTSALDARAEHEIYLRFKALTRGRATLLISHRFSTVRLADHIVVLDGGRIVEQGAHQDLVARGGMYARLYAMQAERYAET